MSIATKPLRALLPIGVALATLTAVSGCANVNEQYRSDNDRPKELQVDLVKMHHAVRFNNGSTDIGQMELAELDMFLQRIRLERGDQIFVSGLGPVDPLTEDRVSTVVSQLGGWGVPARFGGRVAGGARTDGPTVLVTVERHVIIYPDCPDWEKSAVGDFKNTPGSNFGCANVTNLGLMVADPRDLLGGQPMTESDATRLAAGVERYRNDETKEILVEESKVE